MNIRECFTFRFGLRPLTTALAFGCIPLLVSADELLLRIEPAYVASGYVAEMVPGNDGTVIISGDYSPTGARQGELRPPHIVVLDPTGKVVQRLQPPSLSASSDPAQQKLGPFARWRVKAALPQGRFLVDDDAGFVRRLLLAGDGTPVSKQELGYPWSEGGLFPTGPAVVAKDRSVLMGRGPNDLEGRAITRVRFGQESSAYNPSFESNVFKAWPQADLRCARMVVTDDDKIWAWLGFPGDPRARLFRFLPDGRADPLFQPAQPIESLENSDGPFAPESRSTWLGVLPGGRVVIIAGDDSTGQRWLRRLLPDGTTDPTFEVNFNAYQDHPKATLPDGSVLVERRNPSDGPDQRYGLIRIRPDGSRDNSWGAQLPDWWVFNVFGRISVAPMANGSVWVAAEGGRGPNSELYRLNADGNLDTDFDASVISPTPARMMRLLSSGMRPGEIYTLRSSEGLTGGFTNWSEVTVHPSQTQPVTVYERPWTLRNGEPPQEFWQLVNENSP